MKGYSLYALFGLIVVVSFISCKKRESITPQSPVYNYYPISTNNEWVYAINSVYNGLDTLNVKVIGKSFLSDNRVCWQFGYKDIYGFYDDTNYVYISINDDTIMTYTDQNDSSLSEKWIMSDMKNNTWLGVDTLSKFYFEEPFDSMSGFGITYHNIWEIQHNYVYQGSRNIEQFYFEANVGLCSYNIAAINANGPVEQDWHLISYQLH